jgi:GNAT superfamily N-acetyltransferase
MLLEDLGQLARAVEDNWCVAWASLGGVSDEPPTLVDDTAEYLRVFTPAVPEMLLNTVLRYRSREPVVAGDLEPAIAPYRRHRLPFQWWHVLGEEPAGLREELRRLGLESWGGTACMALSLEGWTPPPALERGAAVETAGRVSSHGDARTAHSIICEVFMVSPGPMTRWTTGNAVFQLYLTRWGGTAASALATLRQGTTIGIYHVATRLGFRRRGLAGRLLIEALREAQVAGCRLATLTATPEARPLYESLGFRACGWMEQWVPGPTLMTSLSQGRPSPRAYRGGYW